MIDMYMIAVNTEEGDEVMNRLFMIFRMIRKDIVVMLFALINRRTPKIFRLAILAAILYFVSPVDIVPDAIPAAGLVDDAVVVPAILAGLRQLLPPEVLEDCEHSAGHYGKFLPIVVVMATILLLLWTFLVVYGIYKLIFA
ncbi:YkvA family protein [Anaerovibrio sp.]|uniref:YkvA family protein n=1 Tax=Anaerovibrio sp. TaxID=1872532 RepID=UPI00388E4589